MQESKYKNIAIIRLSALGDIIHTLPAFFFLRAAYPHAKISWIVNPMGAKLLKNFKGIDEIITFDLKKKGLFKKIKEIFRMRSQYKKAFDLVLDFQGLLKSAFLVRLLKSNRSVGFHKNNLREHQLHFFYKETAPFFDESNHVALKNLHLAGFGGNVSIDSIWDRDKNKVHWDKINIRTCDLQPWRRGVSDFLTRNNLEPGHFLILNIGGGWETKLLPIHRYIEIVNRLKDKYKPVILWGNEKEKRVAETVCEETGAVLADFFNFSELILFLGDCRTIVTGDTLALHLADMIRKPSVGLFGPTSPFRNGSIMKQSESLYKKLPCGFCYKKKCGKIECLDKIKTEAIILAIEKRYETS
ncbi:MAG: glycosyltransferase family 9 protein [bacterium]|nr:glycosyltransferase family 9 protein [bacterium]